MRIWIAIRSFFAVLFNASAAEQVQRVLDGAPSVVIESRTPLPEEKKPSLAPKPASRGPLRSEAISLLAALQRESRFLDIVQEPLDGYSDAQVGAAARDVLRNCAAVVDRLFALRPGITQEEGSEVDVPRDYDPMQFRIVGNVSAEPPFRGKLVHHGWTATRCELPVWSGSAGSANVIAPVEVEVS